MNKMNVGAAVPLLLSAVIAASAFAFDERDLQENLSRHGSPVGEMQQAINGYFEGCYSYTVAKAFAARPYTTISSNTNAICIEICRDKGYIVAATKADRCYCRNVLPLPQLKTARDPQSAGNDGPCSVKCPGAYTKQLCRGDECCGGDQAYSVYIIGEIDVLKQLIRRIMLNFRSYDDMVNELLTTDEKNKLNCLCYNGEVTIIATARSVSSSGVGGVKTVQITRYADGSESEIKETNPIPDLEEIQLVSNKLEKIIESEEPIAELPFSNWDILCDNSFGSKEFECSKHYEVTTGTEEQWSIESGFDITTTTTAEFEAGAIFSKVKIVTELSVGISFSSGYTKTSTESISEGFDFHATAEPGQKVEIRFFRSETPVSLKWRANFFADGSVLVRFGSIVERKFHLSELLTRSQRELFAFGTLDFGKRPTIIARTKTTNNKGKVVSENVVSENVEEWPIM